MLIEALVAAVLLVVLVIAFFSSLDGAAKSSASNRSRSVAAGLAQSEMERLRALKQIDPADLTSTRTQAVAGITYTIATVARWIDDSTGVSTCIPGASRSDYVKVTTTVRWPEIGNVKPITSESLFAVRPGEGSIKAQVVDRSGGAVPGILVNLTGPRPLTGTTDADGCVFLGYLPAGTYAAALNSSGYVDATGAQAVSQTTSVADTATTGIIFQYDRASSIGVSFDTDTGAGSTPASFTGFMIGNSSLPAPNTRSFAGPSATTMSTGSTLFPFSDGYSAWAGSCAANKPSWAPIVTVTPGASSPRTLRLPAINIRVQDSTGTALASNVVVTPASGCGSATTGLATTVASNGALTPASARAFPAGVYSVCANTLSGTKRKTTVSVTNQTFAGSPLATIVIPSSGSAGTCP